MTNEDFDIVIFGATSFVGKILCEYLANEYTEPNLSWAMASRSAAKLEELKASLGPAAANVPTLLADSADEDSLKAMCERTAVVISTVGPYALYGDLLIKACVESGTDYCDLTGEPQWIKRMLNKYEAAAKDSGARIVHSCGFDSIPSDLGVKFLQEQAIEKFGAPCESVKMRVKAARGGASGGTIASGVNLYKEAATDPALRAEMRDFYSLCGASADRSVKQYHVNTELDEDFSEWAAPFVMASINTRIVLRSNAVATTPYSASFKYDEAILTGPGPKGRKQAKRLAMGTKLLMGAMAISPIRWFASRFLLPKPGTGPSPEQQLNGFYDLRFVGTTQQGQKIRVQVTGDRDPGYGSTSKMLAQAGISLHRDVDKAEVPGGFWTPATAFNEKIFDRLRSHAGMTFELTDEAA